MGLQTLKDIEMHVLTEANIKEAGIEWIQQLQLIILFNFVLISSDCS